VDVGVVDQAAFFGIVGYVLALTDEVFGVADAVGVEGWLPDCAWDLGADGVGESSLDALHAAFDCLVFGWGEEDVEVFGHDDEGVELVAGLVAVMEEGLEQQVGVGGAGEDGAASVGDGGGRVGVGWHG